MDSAIGTLLREEMLHNHVEFFPRNSEERDNGLVNHGPLTLIAYFMLGGSLDDAIQFNNAYPIFLDQFNASLIPPLALLPSKLIETSLSFEEAIGTCLHDGNKAIYLSEYMNYHIQQRGIRRVFNELLPICITKGSLNSKLFHALLLCSFPIHFNAAIQENKNLPALLPCTNHLIASGIAMLFTLPKNRIDLGELNFRPNAPTEVPGHKEISEVIERVRCSDVWCHLFTEAQETLKEPALPFNIFAYANFVIDDEQKRFKHLFTSQLDIFPFLRADNRKEFLFSLAECVLNYYCNAHGFVAVHLVSVSWAVIILSDIIEDDDTFSDFFRCIWRLICFWMLILDTAAEREGYSPASRARGERKEVVTVEEWEQVESNGKDWNQLISEGLSTHSSHSVKLVYAARCISTFMKENDAPSSSYDETARHCAFIATRYKIP